MMTLWQRALRNFERLRLIGATLGAGLALSCAVAPACAQAVVTLPPPKADPAEPGMQTVVLAGGCFWGVQGVFQHVRGVAGAVSGYDGGASATAHYEIVSTGETGHAESVRITFDPKVVSFGKLLQIFFSVAHDPTELNEQGPDEGAQYRSAIFPSDAQQAATARAYIDQLSAAKVFPARIATRIELSKTFYPAEDYHQNYLTLNPSSPYIVVNDLPKLENLKKTFPDFYRATPKLVPTDS
jgi:peptide-methionine (S)-S-oxide reductase